MQRVGLKDKKCATCRWWQGDREVIFWAQKPFKVECDAKGDCLAIKAPKAYSGACPRWITWEKLPVVLLLAVIMCIGSGCGNSDTPPPPEEGITAEQATQYFGSQSDTE